MPTANDIRTAVTNQIITALQKNDLPPWRRPWSLDPNCGSPLSLSTLRPYRGINVLILSAATNGYQTALYRCLDKREIVINTGGKAPHSIPLQDFTLLLSTTDEHALLQPLRDRMKMVLRFEFYSEPQLTAVVDMRSRALKWDAEEEAFPLIARRSRGTPRLALRRLQPHRTPQLQVVDWMDTINTDLDGTTISNFCNRGYLLPVIFSHRRAARAMA